MSKVAIKGNASGTGTFTVEAPNSNTDRTLVLPDEAGTVVTTAGANFTGNVGVGTGSSVDTLLHLRDLTANDGPVIRLEGSGSNAQNQLIGGIEWENTDTSGDGPTVTGAIRHYSANTTGAGGYTTFHTHDGSEGGEGSDAPERMRIDASGNVLAGTTTGSAGAATGFRAYADGRALATADGQFAGYFNRLSSDGEIVTFRKNGSTVGEIGCEAGDLTIGTGDTGLGFKDGGPWIGPWNTTTNAARDNAIDLGANGVRFDDIWATNGTIQTSDRNDKQDIEELTEAEQRVAVAAKALLRKFRWKDKVAEKGDDARIHFGIIAQDLQTAFEAEGLDAGRYAMFISSTWWETYTDVPAVEEELDDEGNVIVEAKEAYTRTSIYDTADEAPEGATERTRLGVRYPELLAFIIGAL